MNMRWGAALLAAALIFTATPQAQADEVISSDIYEWVQSTSRQNYFFNKQHIYFGQTDKGILDPNIILVPALRIYDQVQIQDVIAKRRWKMQSTKGYNDLVGTAEYMRLDLAAGTVTITKHMDLDSDWGVLETVEKHRTIKLADLTEKDVEGIFYRTILKYAYGHVDEIAARTEKVKHAQLNDSVKKELEKLKNADSMTAGKDKQDSTKDKKDSKEKKKKDKKDK